MKGFNDLRFANSFGRIHKRLNPKLAAYQWEADGVAWRRHRHAHQGPDYSCQCETFVLTAKAGKGAGWSFLYVTETWWDGAAKTVLRSHTWGKLLHGRKTDVLAWMKAQEAKLA